MIETRLNLTVVVPEGSDTAELRVSVSQWCNEQLTRNSTAFRYKMRTKAFDSAQSIIPWAISTLRGASDTAVADLIHRLGDHEELLMHEVEQQLLF